MFMSSYKSVENVRWVNKLDCLKEAVNIKWNKKTKFRQQMGFKSSIYKDTVVWKRKVEEESLLHNQKGDKPHLTDRLEGGNYMFLNRGP
jgi:hypothetical protein